VAVDLPPPCNPTTTTTTTFTTPPLLDATTTTTATTTTSANNNNVVVVAPPSSPLPSSKVFKFILFTTARSGSTWTCQLLDALPNITCGLRRNHLGGGATNSDDELLLKYSYMGNGCCPKKDPDTGLPIGYGDLTYEQYQHDFDTAMTKSILRAKQHQDVEKKVPRGGGGGGSSSSSSSTSVVAVVDRAAGFKLMYDQIPPMFVDSLIQHFVQEDIAILHMVREATILRMASVNNYKTKKILHTTNTTLAALTAETSELVTLNNDDATATLKKYNWSNRSMRNGNDACRCIIPSCGIIMYRMNPYWQVPIGKVNCGKFYPF
jgi:hypothetical protein